MLADAGYLSDANLTCQGPDRLIATGTLRGLHQARPTRPVAPTGGRSAPCRRRWPPG